MPVGLFGAIIFDLYGTVLERQGSSPLRRLLLQTTAIDNIRDVIDSSMSRQLTTLDAFCSHLKIPIPPDWPELEAELRQDVDTVQIYDDVPSTLQAISDAGLRLGLISNLVTPYKEPFFRHGLEAYFPDPIFSCDCGLLKPDGRIYELALEQLGVNASEALMIGDSLRCDVEGPSQVGLRGLHINRGDGRKGENTIGSLSELVSILGIL